MYSVPSKKKQVKSKRVLHHLMKRNWEDKQSDEKLLAGDYGKKKNR